MQFIDTALQGVQIIELEPFADERGFFARAFCSDEFNRRGMLATTAQCNMSFNPRAGTIRGFHYLLAPASEAKLIRCLRGAVFDVIVDMRSNSPTYLQHVAVELTAENRRAVYIPPGMGHAFQTLVDDSEVFYQVTDIYVAELERGLRWDDPTLNIPWPLPATLVSKKDSSWPLLEAADATTSPHLEVSFGPAVTRTQIEPDSLQPR